MAPAVLFLSRCGNESDQHFPAASARSTGSRGGGCFGSGGVVGVVVVVVSCRIPISCYELSWKLEERREVGSWLGLPLAAAGRRFANFVCYQMLSFAIKC